MPRKSHTVSLLSIEVLRNNFITSECMQVRKTMHLEAWKFNLEVLPGNSPVSGSKCGSNCNILDQSENRSHFQGRFLPDWCPRKYGKSSYQRALLPWRELSIQIICSFLIGLFVFYYWAVRVLYTIWIEVSYQIPDLQKFSPIVWFVFSLCGWFLLKHIKFILKSNLSFFFFYHLCFWCHI